MVERRVLVTGRGLVEAPRWHDGRLYFSDWTAGEVLATDADGHTEVVAHVASLPLCSAWLPDGRLLIVSSAEGRLLRREPDGSLVTHAELGGPGWNDIVVDGRGNAYVNTVNFDMTAGEAVRPGHVVLASADGTVRRVAGDLLFPNGMAVTADNATLIVAESYGPRLTAFDVGAGGDLSGRRVFAELEDAPDGICVDAEGAVWYATVPGRSCRPSTSTAAASPAPSAAPTVGPCSSPPPSGAPTCPSWCRPAAASSAAPGWRSPAPAGPDRVQQLATVNPPGPRNYQAFAVLTMCRDLYVLERGVVVPKPVAAAWAARRLGPPWPEEAARALSWRADERPDDRHLPETVALVAAAVELARRAG
jgi:hypothetical protein